LPQKSRAARESSRHNSTSCAAQRERLGVRKGSPARRSPTLYWTAFGCSRVSNSIRHGDGSMQCLSSCG
ncbi:unnamed protein product, partial [Pylaiella littoralis]